MRVRPTESKPFVYLDTETTGLDPTRHDLWEVSYRVSRGVGHSEEQRTFQFPVQITEAEPAALRIGGYWRRFQTQYVGTYNQQRADAQTLAIALNGAIVAGVNPSFDTTFVDKMLRSYSLPSGNHYYTPLDVASFARAVLLSQSSERFAMAADCGTDALAELMGVSIPDDLRHTAAGDALLAQRMHEKSLSIIDAGSINA